MSYRRAWLLVESLKQSFREPVTTGSPGGTGGGGLQVTAFGVALIDSYRALEREFAALAERRLQPVSETVARRRKPAPRVSVRSKLRGA